MSTKRIRKRCCIGGCLNTDINPVSLHRVPEDTRAPGIKEKWCSIIRKSKGKPGWVPLKNSVVCGHHFTWRDFHGKRDQGFVKTSLRKEAVPSRKLGPLITPTPSPPPEEEEPAAAMDSVNSDLSLPGTSQRTGQSDKRSVGQQGASSSDDLHRNLFKLQRQLNQVIENNELSGLLDPNDHDSYLSAFDEDDENFLNLDLDLGCEEELGEVDSDDEFEGESFDEEKLYMDESELQPSLMLEVEVAERKSQADNVAGEKVESLSPPLAPKPRFPCPSCPKSFLRQDHLELHQIIHGADKDRKNSGPAGPSKKPRMEVEEPSPSSKLPEAREASSALGNASTEVNGQKPVKPREWPKRFLSLPPSTSSATTVPSTPANVTTVKPKSKPPPPLIPISSVPRFQTLPEEVKMKDDKVGNEEQEAGRKYPCRFCPKKFARTDHLQQHLTIHTGSRPYKCHICPKAFPIIVTLKRHLKTHTGAKEFACPKCPSRFSQIGHLKRHMDSPYTHASVATATTSTQELDNGQDAENHDGKEGKQQGSVPESEQEQQCKFCGESVLGLRALLQHYQTKHYQKSVQDQLMGNAEDDEQEQDIEFAFICRLCDQGFASREERFSHEILVHKIKNANARLECKYCKKVICTFNGLAKHVRRHEEGRSGTTGNGIALQAYEQEEADEQEESDGADAVDAPVPTSDVTLWTCRLCPQVFLEQLERLVHENSVHNTKDTSQVHVCKHCSKEIATFRGLTKHLRNIHGERTIPEDQRPRLPTTKKKPIPQPVHTQVALMEYEQDDDGDSGSGQSEVYICRLCDLMFPSIKDRLTHENDDHGTRDAEPSLQCKFCYKSISKFKHYLEHLRRRHPDETFVRILTEEETMDTTPRHFLDF